MAPVEASLSASRSSLEGGEARVRREGVRVGYLTSMYPAVSHTFIRREIAALEGLGYDIDRYSIRESSPSDLIDEQDVREREITKVLLRGGIIATIPSVLQCLLTRPVGTMKALALAVRLSRGSHVGVARHLAYFAEGCRLALWMRSRRVRHLHAHFGTNPAAVALLASRLSGIGFSFTMHGAACFDVIASIGIRLKAEYASFIVAVSSYGRSQILRRLPQSLWDRVHVVRCGLQRDYCVDEPPMAPADRRLVCVARLSPEKGHSILLDAATLIARTGQRFKVVVAGAGPSGPQLRDEVRNRALDDYFEFVGALDSRGVREQLCRSRALVIPSFMEGLPVVAMEAFAAGRPVIATAVAGTPELVQDGRTGWLVPPGDAAALAAAMMDALSKSPAELTEMGQRGRRRVLDDFVVEDQAWVLARLFDRCLGPAKDADEVDAARV
jgi:colanic acid/amylovoran biosynthesis glycosyltransferase